MVLAAPDLLTAPKDAATVGLTEIAAVAVFDVVPVALVDGSLVVLAVASSVTRPAVKTV